MFLNDLEEFLLTKDIVGLKSITDELETELEIYLKIFVMLYADDTILLAESAENLQVQLNAFVDNWEMKVNVDKTKIMVFGFGKLRQNLKFTYENVDIEIVKQFNYLGVIFT
jgi:predicted HTH domain antitoxin